MEMWLKTSGKAFRFPVLPSSFTVNNSTILDSTSIVNKGEVVVFSGNSLKSTEITSFFPSVEYSFCAYKGFPQPYECVKLIEDWRKKGQDVRLIITDTDVNMLMIIESFEYGERAGTRDIEFTISLREYIPLSIPTVSTQTQGPTQNTPRPSESPKPTTQKTHKVKKGDCLWDIAKKYYGNGSLYPKIKEANKSKYPSLAKNNIIYSYKELIIP